MQRHFMLKMSADKLHKFKQGKSNALLGSTSRGECFALGVHVLNELVHGREAFEPTAGAIHSENGALIQRLEVVQNLHNFINLDVADLIAGPYFQLRVLPGSDTLTLDLGNPAPALERCADGLARGKGALVFIQITEGTHAVALCRGANNQLYFFDANCGLYHVIMLQGFFQEWVSINGARLNSGRQVWYVEAK